MGLMRKRKLLFGEGGEKFFALRVHICLHVTSSIYAPTPLHFYFPPKRKSAFRAFFLSSSSGSLSAFLNRFNCQVIF